MATILEEAIRLGADPNLAIAALSMPSRAPVTGAMRYTIPGEGTSEFIRAKTPEEVAAAARQLGGVAAANANPYAGRVFGNTIGQAQGASLNRRQQDIASMQFQQQMAAANDRARLAAQADAAERAMKLRLGQQEIDARRENSMQEFVARMAGVDARYGGGAGTAPARTIRSGAAAPAGGTTIADILYGQQAQLLAQQPGIELSNEALESLSEGRLSAAQSLFGAQGAQRGFDQSILSADEAEAIGVPPYTTMADAVRLASQRGPGNEAALKILESRIAAERASGRLGNALPTAPAPQLSPLAALLLRQPGTAGPGGTIQYSPEQVSAARSALGWRGAYGGPGVSAFGSNPAEQARMQAARRMATMAPAAAQVAAEPAAMPAPTLASGDYRLVPRSSGIEAAAVNPLGASALGLSAILSTMFGNRRPVDPGTQAEVERRRLAGEFPSTTAYIERYPQWLRSLLAAPGEITPAGPSPGALLGNRTIRPMSSVPAVGAMAPMPGVGATTFPQAGGSVADFTDPTLPAPSAVESLLLGLTPSPAPINGGSVDVLAGLREALLAGYPSPTPIGGTFDMNSAVPTYGAPTPYGGTPVRDAVLAGYPSPTPIGGTYDMMQGVADAANLIRSGAGAVGGAARRLVLGGYPAPAPLPAGASYNPINAVLDAILRGYPAPTPVNPAYR